MWKHLSHIGSLLTIAGIRSLPVAISIANHYNFFLDVMIFLFLKIGCVLKCNSYCKISEFVFPCLYKIMKNQSTFPHIIPIMIFCEISQFSGFKIPKLVTLVVVSDTYVKTDLNVILLKKYINMITI